MKKSVYRIAALLFLIQYPEYHTLFDLEGEEKSSLADDLGLESHPMFAITFLELLDQVVDEQFHSWWDVIASWNVDLWSAPWADSMSHIIIAAQKGLIEYPEKPYSWTESEHHRQWRNSIVERKGYVKD